MPKLFLASIFASRSISNFTRSIFSDLKGAYQTLTDEGASLKRKLAVLGLIAIPHAQAIGKTIRWGASKAFNRLKNAKINLLYKRILNVVKPGYIKSGQKAAEISTNTGIWGMSLDGQVINGRYYTRHALERMAPNTIEVRAELSIRAIKKGYVPNTDEFRKYVDPRVYRLVLSKMLYKMVLKNWSRFYF